MVLALCPNRTDDALEPDKCRPNVGAGLLANTVCQSMHLLLNRRIREQARSHILVFVRL